jgi:GTP-binding protein Era
MLKADDVARLLTLLAELLPNAQAGYDPDFLTSQPTHFFVREYVREQVLINLRAEVPHAVAVSVDRIEDAPEIFRASLTIHVEKQGQRGILVGRGGSTIKRIGIGARQRIEALLGKQVHLELFARVTPRWKDMPRQLAELGYTPGGTDAQGLTRKILEPEEPT